MNPYDPNDAEFEAFIRSRPGFAQIENALAEQLHIPRSEVPLELSATVFTMMDAQARGELTDEEIMTALNGPQEAARAVMKMLRNRGVDVDDIEREMNETANDILDSWIDVTEDWRNFMLEGGEPAMAYAVTKVSFNPDSPPGENQQAGFQMEAWVDEEAIPEQLRMKMAMSIIAAHHKWRRDNGIEE